MKQDVKQQKGWQLELSCQPYSDKFLTKICSKVAWGAASAACSRNRCPVLRFRRLTF